MLRSLARMLLVQRRAISLKTPRPTPPATTILLATALKSTLIDNKSDDDDAEEEESTSTDHHMFTTVQKAYTLNEKSLANLIDVLCVAVAETSYEYRECMKKQMAIIHRGMVLGPVGEHWDDLTKYRVEANDKKRELDKYKVLSEHVGHMCFSNALSNSLIGNEPETPAGTDYNRLVTVVEAEFAANKKCEDELMELNKQSILQTDCE